MQTDLHLCPPRLLAVGQAQRYSKEDKLFLKHALQTGIPEVFKLGGSWEDVVYDYCRGWIRFPHHEADAPGHVHYLSSLPKEHTLNLLRRYIPRNIRNNLLNQKSSTTLLRMHFLLN